MFSEKAPDRLDCDGDDCEEPVDDGALCEGNSTDELASSIAKDTDFRAGGLLFVGPSASILSVIFSQYRKEVRSPGRGAREPDREMGGLDYSGGVQNAVTTNLYGCSFLPAS